MLLTTTGACAIHCRYCFRRHYPYAQFNPARDDWRAVIDRIAADHHCTEVILSGGDPLLLADTQLDRLLQALAAIDHVQRLRIHTRVPVALPARVNSTLLDLLAALPKPLAIVWHINHANEIDEDVAMAAAALRRTGATLLNQSVLLRGVNDRVDTLAELCAQAYACGILPYYLHLLDRVRGAAHFEVADSTARALENALRARLPGYLMPRFVRELPGLTAKQPLQ
jgi:EF-P beta-lysylation protein EpmB